jgi:triacylglycerol lipase
MSFLTRLPENLYARDAFKNVVTDAAFDLRTARALMWLSQLTYEDPASRVVGNTLAIWGLRRLGCDPVSSPGLPLFREPNVIVAENDDAIYVAIEGTDPLNIGNWLANFDVPPSDLGIHTGFQGAANTLWGNIDRCVSAAQQGKNRPLFVTGHSLGGAIAVLIARKFADQPTPVTAVYTFGQPRVGDARFMRAYNLVLGSKTYRFVYGKDIVPAVPSAPYRHVGRYAYAASGRFSGTVTAYPDPSLPDGCSDEPATTRAEVASAVELLKYVPNQILSFATNISSAWKILLGLRGPSSSRSDAVALLIERLPVPIRDHIPDRYWTALRLTG